MVNCWYETPKHIPGSQMYLSQHRPKLDMLDEICRAMCGCLTRLRLCTNDTPESGQIGWPGSGCHYWAVIKIDLDQLWPKLSIPEEVSLATSSCLTLLRFGRNQLAQIWLPTLPSLGCGLGAYQKGLMLSLFFEGESQTS